MPGLYKNVIALKPEPNVTDKKKIHAGVVDSQGNPLLESFNRRKSIYVNELDLESNSIPKIESRISGTSIYGGVIHRHFGHFFLESLSRLYVDDGIRDVYFYLQPYDFCATVNDLPEYAKEILSAVLGSLDRVKLIRENLSFEKLIIPEQGFVIRSHILPSLRKLYRKLGERIINIDRTSYETVYDNYKGKKIWLSRSALPSAFIYGESELEDILKEEGFEVVALEKQKFVEQIAILNAAAGIAGFTGSAFHILLLSSNVSAPIVHFNRWRYKNENFEILLPSELYNSYFYYDTWRSSDYPKSPMSNTKHNLTGVLEKLEFHSLISCRDLDLDQLERVMKFYNNSASKNSIQRLSEKINNCEKDSDVLRDIGEYFFAKGDYISAFKLYEVASLKFPNGGFIKKRLVELRETLSLK